MRRRATPTRPAGPDYVGDDVHVDGIAYRIAYENQGSDYTYCAYRRVDGVAVAKIARSQSREWIGYAIDAQIEAGLAKRIAQAAIDADLVTGGKDKWPMGVLTDVQQGVATFEAFPSDKPLTIPVDPREEQRLSDALRAGDLAFRLHLDAAGHLEDYESVD